MGIPFRGPDPTSEDQRGVTGLLIDFKARLLAGLNPAAVGGTATEAQAGVTQLATDAEVTAGSALKPLSPARLATRLAAVTARSVASMTGLNGSGPAYIRLATIYGVDGNNGANAEILVAGLGSIGAALRSTALVTIANRGTATSAAVLKVMWLAGDSQAATFYSRHVADFTDELWMQVPQYQFPPRATLLDGYNLTTPLADVVQSTAPSSLVASDSRETDWAYGSGISAWDSSFANDVRRFAGGLLISLGLRKTDSSAIAAGTTLITLGSTLKVPQYASSGWPVVLGAYSTQGPGWNASPVNVSVQPNGAVVYNGSPTVPYGIFGSFVVPTIGG